MTPKNIVKLGGLGAAVIVLLSLGTCSMEQVEAGNRGIFVRYGEAVEQTGPGLKFMNPLTTELKQMSIRTKKMTGTMYAYTKDVQNAEVKYTMTYYLRPDKALQMYTEKGEEWAPLLIPQVVEDSIKNEFGKSDAVKDTINRRDMVTFRIKKNIKEKLAARDILLEGFEIRNITFSDKFEAAVEAKQVAVERAAKAKNDTVRIQEEAKQRIITAEAQAKAIQIKTDALRGSPELANYELATRWNGVLPQIMAGGNATLPLLNLNK